MGKNITMSKLYLKRTLYSQKFPELARCLAQYTVVKNRCHGSEQQPAAQVNFSNFREKITRQVVYYSIYTTTYIGREENRRFTTTTTTCHTFSTSMAMAVISTLLFLHNGLQNLKKVQFVPLPTINYLLTTYCLPIDYLLTTY